VQKFIFVNESISNPEPDTVAAEANATSALVEQRQESEKMARRRYQDPEPKRHGKHWTIVVWEDYLQDGKLKRRQRRIRLAPLKTRWRDVLRLRDERLKPVNQGMLAYGSATTFEQFVRETYIPNEMPLLAKTTRGRYQGVLDKYLLPPFGTRLLGDLKPGVLQEFFSIGMAKSAEMSKLGPESKEKIRVVLASVLKRASRKYGLLDRNPMELIQLPRSSVGKRRKMPYLTPEQFDELVTRMPEPYATMVYVAIYTGLRISELVALTWEDIGCDSINVDKRYCRGDLSRPKSRASDAKIAVAAHVIERIHHLKLLTVEGNAGGNGAVRHYQLVKKSGPADLVFQSVRTGRPMRDNNILTRFLKPAGRELGLGFVNWRCLRTSTATWHVTAGANIKDVQGLMRHAQIQTTLDIYAQQVPESQRSAIDVTSKMAAGRIANAREALRRAATTGLVN
jgi:integrase